MTVHYFVLCNAAFILSPCVVLQVVKGSMRMVSYLTIFMALTGTIAEFFFRLLHCI